MLVCYVNEMDLSQRWKVTFVIKLGLVAGLLTLFTLKMKHTRLTMNISFKKVGHCTDYDSYRECSIKC